MASDAKLTHLSQVKLFSSLTKKELTLLGRASDELALPAGKVIVEEGAIGRELFVILEGRAVVRRGGRRIALLGPGQYFGELALLTKAPRVASVAADTDVLLLVLSQREFNAVLDQIPAVTHKMLVTMAERLREADTRAMSH